MGFNAVIDQNVQQAHEEANSGGGGAFPPLPKGEYQMRVVPLSPDKGLNFEVVPFSKNNDAYRGKEALRLRLQIIEESPLGAKRTYFVRIPLFSRYEPSQKNPKGASARDYFSFFEKAVGVPTEKVLAGDLPGWETIGGMLISARLGDPIPPDEYNELGSNEVSFYGPAGNIASTPTRIEGKPVAPWLDVEGKLRVDYVAPVSGGPVHPGAQTAWTPTGPAPAASASQAAPAAWTPGAPAQAPAASGAPQDSPWLPSAGDTALAAAAASGPSY